MDFPLKYKQLWSNWDVRLFILLSLNIQIILIFLGHMRRTFNSRWIRMIVWCCYLLADVVAIFVLGQLSNNMDASSSSNAIIAFWAPFLILHLGGPDSITAYSVEDNELWARHLLWLIYHLSIAFYVFFRSLPNTRLLVPTLLIFFVAIIKYLERSYSLYRASVKGFGNSLTVSSSILILNKFILSFVGFRAEEDLEVSSKAFLLYILNKGAFIDALPIVIDKYIRNTISESEDILKLLSMVLSYAYDEFYTKTIIIHSRAGYVLRVLCSICISLSFSLFFIAPKHDFKHVDVAITYLLLSASICLDIVATVMFVFSDQMVISLDVETMRSNWKVLLRKHIVMIKMAFHKRKYRLRKIPQLNLFINLIKISKNKIRISEGENEAPQGNRMNWVAKMLVQWMTLVQGMKVFTPWSYDSIGGFEIEAMQPVQATDELIEVISSCLKSHCSNILQDESTESAGVFFAFQKVRSIDQSNVPTFVHLFVGLPLDQQVLVWHITTDLCLNLSEENEIRLEMEACRLLSNYMMYLVLNQYDMGGEISLLLRKLQLDIEEFDQEIDALNVEDLCKIIMNIRIDQPNDNLFVISQVLAGLMFVITYEEKWEVMKMIWVELLIKQAKNLRASWHVKQLSKGDNLLTLIWLFHKNMEIDLGDFNINPSPNSVLIDQIKEAEDLLSMIKHNRRINNSIV